ncbi:hypothetical protein MVES_001411 [Malassezia vespertilionis]|uniref:J domain-containing protein n=1 Tax=Malassezia vespertilionis TaxID=2020962 RepID=A0A2N1JDC1_9BASI|nr:hypothetical protein MVES_001411 [Malassezia vespertilionis]
MTASRQADMRAWDQDASLDQIRDAYKTLAVAFHPDKHPDPTNKEMAEDTFRSIQKAYEVLSDPERRAVYDHFGEQGLQSTWSVAVRGQSPAEMRAEFERQSRMRQAADAESMVRSRGEFNATINASSLFMDRPPLSPLRRRIAPLTWSERLAIVHAIQLIGKHSFDMQVSNTTSASISGQMLSRGSAGGGNLVGTLKTQWSPQYLSEITATMLKPHVLTAKGQYTVDENLFFNYALVSTMLAAPPSVTVTWGQRLSSKSTLTGFTSLKTGPYTIGGWGAGPDGLPIHEDTGMLVVGVTKQDSPHTGWTTQMTLSDTDQSLGYEWNMRILDGIIVRSGISLGTGIGFSVFTNGERRITEHIRLLLGVECGLGTGVLFKVRVSRLGQRVVLPILLSPTFRPNLAMAATLLPAAAIALSHYLYFMPMRQRKRAERITELRRENIGVIEQRRTAAEQTRELLRGQAEKRASTEIGRQGLVVVQAYYGRLDLFPALMDVPEDVLADNEQLARLCNRMPDMPVDTLSAHQPLWWDARIQLQMLVNQSQLIIPAGRSKSKLIGFFDPCIGEEKHLLVRYVFRNKVHQLLATDTGAVAAPLRSQEIV